MRKLPPDALSYYVALGPCRTYRAVASNFGVTERAVAYRAVRERWKARAQEIERELCEEALVGAKEKLRGWMIQALEACQTVREAALQCLAAAPIDGPSAALEVLQAANVVERTLLAGEMDGEERRGPQENR